MKRAENASKRGSERDGGHEAHPDPREDIDARANQDKEPENATDGKTRFDASSGAKSSAYTQENVSVSPRKDYTESILNCWCFEYKGAVYAPCGRGGKCGVFRASPLEFLRVLKGKQAESVVLSLSDKRKVDGVFALLQGLSRWFQIRLAVKGSVCVHISETAAAAGNDEKSSLLSLTLGALRQIQQLFPALLGVFQHAEFALALQERSVRRLQLFLNAALTGVNFGLKQLLQAQNYGFYPQPLSPGACQAVARMLQGQEDGRIRFWASREEFLRTFVPPGPGDFAERLDREMDLARLLEPERLPQSSVWDGRRVDLAFLGDEYSAEKSMESMLAQDKSQNILDELINAPRYPESSAASQSAKQLGAAVDSAPQKNQPCYSGGSRVNIQEVDNRVVGDVNAGSGLQPGNPDPEQRRPDSQNPQGLRNSIAKITRMEEPRAPVSALAEWDDMRYQQLCAISCKQFAKQPSWNESIRTGAWLHKRVSDEPLQCASRSIPRFPFGMVAAVVSPQRQETQSEIAPFGTHAIVPDHPLANQEAITQPCQPTKSFTELYDLLQEIKQHELAPHAGRQGLRQSPAASRLSSNGNAQSKVQGVPGVETDILGIVSTLSAAMDPLERGKSVLLMKCASSQENTSTLPARTDSLLTGNVCGQPAVGNKPPHEAFEEAMRSLEESVLVSQCARRQQADAPLVQDPFFLF